MSSNSPTPTPSPSTESSSPVSTSSAQPTSTSNAPTSSPSPTTSATPTTTPQSSPAQSSSPVASTPFSSTADLTSSPSPSSAGAAASTSSRASSTTSSFTSQVATTLFSTDPAGSVVVVTTSVPQVITTTVSSPSSNSGSSSHTGVIVGAVVGGVAGLTLLALLFFCIRRRVRKDEFDGNFDPDRVVGHTDGAGGTLPRVDLAEEVTPFPHAYSDQGNGSMRQYEGSPYLPIPSSFATSDQSNPEFYQAGAGSSAMSQPFVAPGAYAPQVNAYGTAPADWHNPRPGASPPASTVSYNSSSARGTKEREALGRGGQAPGLDLATQEETAEGSGDVLVHQDAGRAPAEESAPPREIPPAYESIPQD